MADPEETPQDYVAQAHGRVLLQYRESTKLLAFIDALLAPVQEVENVLTVIPTLDDVDVAGGVNLDATGDLVGQPRLLVNGDLVTEDQYRLLIKARIARNVTHSTGPDMIALLVQIFAAPVLLTDFGNMSIAFAIGITPTLDQVAVLDGDILPRPMGVQMTRSYFNPTNHFGYSDDSAALGYSDPTVPVVGGVYSEGF